MKVLLMNHFPLVGSGSGVYTYEVAKCLRQKGIEVAVLYPENVQNPLWIGLDQGPLPAPKTYYKDKDQIEHFILPFNDSAKQYTKSLSFNFPCFTSHPRSHETFSRLSEEDLQAYTALLRAGLRSAIEIFKPDLLHIQHVWIGASLALESGLPYIITCHGTDLMGYEAMVDHRTMAESAARGSEGIIAISKDVCEKAMSYYGLDAHQVHLIHNGYNPDLFNLKEKTLPQTLQDCLGEDEAFISFAGKFTAFKGIDLLLEAAAIYEKALPNLHTFIAGDGVLKAQLLKQSRALALKKVHFIGHQKPEDLAAVYSRSLCHVVPSRGEPFGLVAVEAMASGAFVIGTQAGGLSEIITPEVGVLVPPEDSRALALAVIEYASRARTGLERKKSSQHGAAHYAWDMTARRVMALYDQALQIQYSDQLV